MILAIKDWRMVRSSFQGIPHVVAVSAGIKMVRVNTHFYIASVANYFSIWNYAYKKFVRRAMRLGVNAYTEISISIGVWLSLPNPTALGVNNRPIKNAALG